MQIFWLSVGIVTILSVTYLGLTQGFGRWVSYYFFGVLAIFLYLIRRFMMKRMEKNEALFKGEEQPPRHQK